MAGQIGEVQTLLLDNFNTALSATRWDYNHYEDGGSYLGRTQMRQSLPTVSNGYLHLRLDSYNPTSLPNSPSFYGSEAKTKQKFSTTSGGISFEVKAHLLTSTPGVVGGMFAYSSAGATHDEIDFEAVSKKINSIQTNVYDDEPLGAGHSAFHALSTPLTENHLYRIEWLPDRVRWFVDGKLVRESTQYVPQGAMALHLNIWAPAQDWIEAYSNAINPVTTAGKNTSYYFEVDSVKVSRLSTQYGSDGDDALVGTSLSDWLVGKKGNDTLRGGIGADTMLGGAGNDAYFVDNIGDVIIELAEAGTDTIFSTVHCTLADHVENLVLSGSGSLNGNGNGGNNIIRGNSGVNVLKGLAGNDTLNGGLGADSMYGGLGNDIYIVDNARDRTIEASGADAGTDTVKANLSWTLATHIENLTLTGSDAVTGTGNILRNIITGNDSANILAGLGGKDTLRGNGGNDRLNGGTGADTLIGGGDKDIFLFNTALGATNIDTLLDFAAVDDTVQLSKEIFSKLTVCSSLNARLFRASMNGTAADTNDYILYSTKTGGLFYDADGNGDGVAIQFATLSTKPQNLTAADFSVVS